MVRSAMRPRLRSWKHRLRSCRDARAQARTSADARRADVRAPGGKLADVVDLTRGEFGARFRARFDDGAAHLVPRKRWELCWLAQKYEEMHGSRRVPAMLGLGVGQEPLIYHFAHLGERVVATDRYDEHGVWVESRIAAEQVRSANPFPYPRERLAVRNMDMRRLEFSAQSFDVVWSCSSVEHVASLSEFIQVFREIHRVLKPDGVALITTEFSLGEPYFLPGVLSLWEGCGLFIEPLEGLALLGPVDLRYNDAVAGNHPLPRGDVRRLSLLRDFTGGPSGVCIHVGYTRLIPVAFALQKTGKQFRWPRHLNAPAWYPPFSSGIEAFRDRPGASHAADCFRTALDRADLPGARLHCFRQLTEACVHAGKAGSLRKVLREFAAAMPELPDDDDALDLIAFVAAGQGQLALARRCWERAQRCPSALPSSRLRIRCNQLAAELEAHGADAESQQLNALADAAWCEALAFHGPDDPQIVRYGNLLARLRKQYRLGSQTVSRAWSPATAAALPATLGPVTPRSPHFDLSAPPPRPMVPVDGGLALTKTVYGHKMYVDPRSQVGACFLMDGYWEEWIVRHLKDYVEPGMHALDIGANMGFYTLLLCDLVGPDGHVTAFEPWPRYYEILRRNVNLNGFQGRCTLEKKGVHAGTGKTELVFVEEFGTGGLKGSERFFEEYGPRYRPKEVWMETVSLDDYMAATSRSVDFIKLDADGSEPFIFRGMKSLLRSDRPLTIFCEFCPRLLREMGVDPAGFLKEIEEAGFAVSAFAPEGIQKVESFEALAGPDWTELLLVRDRDDTMGTARRPQGGNPGGSMS